MLPRLPALLIAFLAAAAGADEIPIRGRVADASGTAIERARIELYAAASSFDRGTVECGAGEAPLPLAVELSDADGGFEIRAPGPGRFRVVVRDPGRLALARTLPLLVETTGLAMAELAPTVDLRVAVADPEGRPVAGARVEVSFVGYHDARAGAWRPWARRGVTGDDGTTVFAVGENEIVRVSATAPGFVAAVQERLALLNETTLRLSAGAERTVTVLDGAEPVAGALVRVGTVPVGLTGEDGRLSVTVPREGPPGLAAETSSGLYGQAETDGQDRPVVVLKAPETLGGRVRDASTGLPLGGAWLAFQEAVVESGIDGGYVLPFRVDQEPTPLFAAARGYAAQVLRRVERLRALDVALEPAADLRGRVIDELDAPVAGAEIVLANHPSFGMLVDESSRRLAVSGADGRFRFSVSPAELFELRVTKPGYVPARAEASARDEPFIVVLARSRTAYGHVLDLDEQPIEGAEVRLWPAEKGPRGESVSPHEAATGADGRFELQELRSGRFDLRVTAPGFAPLAVAGLNVALDRDRPTDLGTVILEDGVQVSGRVVDRRGRPIAEAAVAYDFWGTEGELKPWELDATEVETGGDGGFVIGDLRAGDKLDLSVWHIDYAYVEVHGVECPAEDLELVLEASAVVRGRVVEAYGAPVEGAEVSARFQASGGSRLNRNAWSGADGGFELSSLSPSRVEVAARAEGFKVRRVWLDLKAGESVEDLTLRLETGAEVEGTVRGPDGEPVAGARIVFSQGGRYSNYHTKPTDALGRFVLAGLEVGPLQVEVKPGLGQRFKRPELPPAVRHFDVKPGVNTLEILLDAGHEVHGRVVDAQFRGVVGARVSLGERHGGSGADGAFTVRGVPDGLHRLSASKEGFAAYGRDDVKVEGGPLWDLEVVLERGGAIVGRVLGLGEETARTHLQVVASSLEEQWAQSSVDYEGRFRLAPLAPGKWRLETSDPASGRAARTSVELEPGVAEAEVDLEFVAGLVFSGRLLVDGEPEAGSRFWLQGLDILYRGRTRTDYGGNFRFENLQPGRYQMRIHSDRQEVLDVRRIELTSDEHMDVDLATGQLHGRVVDAADATPLADGEVVLQPSHGAGAGMAAASTTDSRGFFRFARLTAGSYRLRVRRQSYAPLERRIEIESGDGAEDLELGLERTAGLVLRVSDAAGRAPDIVFAAALASPAEEPVVAGRFLTGAEGSVRLDSLPDGHWTLLLRSPSSGTARLAASAPGDPLPVVLPSATRLEITVPALVDGGEVATATITGAEGVFVAVTSGGTRRQWPVRDGWAVVDGLRPGAWSVTVRAVGGRSWTARAVASAGGGSVRLTVE